MCSLKRLHNVFRISVVILFVAGSSSLCPAQSSNHTAVPQNQAQLQTQQKAAQNQKSGGGLFSKLGGLIRGDDDPKNTPPVSPANVGAQTMAQNTEQTQPVPLNQGTAVVPPRPQSAGHSAGSYSSATRPPTTYTQPTTYAQPTQASPTNAGVAVAQATTPSAANRPPLSQTVSDSSRKSTYAISGDPLTRMKLLQEKAGSIKVDAPGTDNRMANSRESGGPPSPPPVSAGEERTSVGDRSIRSLSTESVQKIASRDTSRHSLTTTDEQTEEDAKLLSRRIEMPPMEKPNRYDSEANSDNFGHPVKALSTKSKSETDLASETESTERLPVTESRKPEPSSRQSEPMTNVTNIERIKPVVKNNDDLIRHQTPVLSIVTEGPNRIIVGKKETYKFVVTNNSNAPAEEVVLNIELPRWAENNQAPMLTAGSTTLSPQNEDYGIFQWQVGRIEPNKSETLELHLVLRERRSFDLKFTSDFKQSASHAKIEVQQPVLKMELDGPEEVLWGAEEKYNLRIRNIGNGDANDILVKLSAAGAIKGETTIDSLKIGNQHMIDVFVTAKEANELTINVQATGPYGLSEEMTKHLVVKRAELELDIDAPGMQYVGNTMEYVIIARNIGTADSLDSIVETALPLGVKYISSDRNGEFDANTNRVRWNAGTIPVNGEFVCSVSCEAKREGECRLEAKATEKTGLVLTADVGTLVEAIADVTLEIEKPQGPIEVGIPAEYVIVVANRGTKAAENIDITAIFSEAIEPNSVSGAKAKINVDRREIVFDRVPFLAANDTLRYRIKVMGLTAGNHKMHADLVCRSTETSLTCQQMSRFYQGRHNRSATPLTGESNIPNSSSTYSTQNAEPLNSPQDSSRHQQPVASNGQPVAPNSPFMTAPESRTLTPVPAAVPSSAPSPLMSNTPSFHLSSAPSPVPSSAPSASSTVAAPRGGLVSSHMHAESASQNQAAGKIENGTSQLPTANFGQLQMSQPTRSLPRTGAGITSLSPPPAIASATGQEETK